LPLPPPSQFSPRRRAMGLTISGYCCGGRVEKLEEDPGRPLVTQLARHAEKPEQQDSEGGGGGHRRPRKKDSALKKLGKSCCCGNLGDRSQRKQPESQAPMPEAAPAAQPEELEGGPAAPRAAELAGSRMKTALRHDFNGRWQLVSVEGDMDSFLADFGRGWFYRVAARRMNFGIGTRLMEISQEGDELSIDRCLGSGSHVIQQWTVGAGVYDCFDDLGPFTFESDWDADGVLVVDGTLHSTGDPFTMRRLRHSVEELFDEITSCNGNTIREVYKLDYAGESA